MITERENQSAGDGGRPSQGIQWEEVHARLERAAVAARETLRPSTEQARAILDERARALARIPATPPRAAEILEVVTFGLGVELYAIETRHVRRVVRLSETRSIPGAPEFLFGIINLRGEILAVFDLHRFFGVPDGGVTDLSRVIVMGADRDEFGVLVDVAHGVRSLRIDEVLDPPGSTAGTGRQHLRGVTADALIVVDGVALLGDDRLVIDQGDD